VVGIGAAYFGATTDRPTSVPGKANSMTEITMPLEMFDTTVNGPIFRVPNSFLTSWVHITGAVA